MKKTFNVNGTKFTVDVEVTTEDYYETLPNDYKKLLYLLGQVSRIGSQLDHEFTTRNRNLKDWDELDLATPPDVVKKGLKKLYLSTRQKNEVIKTIDSTMWWFEVLKDEINRL